MDYNELLNLSAHHGTPALYISAGRIRRNVQELQQSLSGVSIYYALKANAHPEIVRILSNEGVFFDICTNGEVDIITECGISGTRCIHTHPIKRNSDIEYALAHGINTFVADNVAEIDKLQHFKNDISVLIRMSILNPQCPVNLSYKFGVSPEQVLELIDYAAERGIDIEGIAFHAGSQNENVAKYLEALGYCRDICRQAALRNIEMRTIDIGGGFPIEYTAPVPNAPVFCQPITDYLHRYFSSYRVIAEPGRFIVGSAGTLAVRIIGKALRNGIRWYYLDDGVYGCFSGRIFDHATYPLFVPPAESTFSSTLAGPTCDSVDVIYENILLPEMEIGDILMFNAMGAYTSASATTFNGFPRPPVIITD